MHVLNFYCEHYKSFLELVYNALFSFFGFMQSFFVLNLCCIKVSMMAFIWKCTFLLASQFCSCLYTLTESEALSALSQFKTLYPADPFLNRLDESPRYRYHLGLWSSTVQHGRLPPFLPRTLWLITSEAHWIDFTTTPT